MSGLAYRGPRRMRVAAGLALLGLLLGGCGLPSGSTAVEVPKAEVPYGLLDPATPSPTPSLTPGVPLTGATIFLADGQQRLVPVDVQVPAAPLQPLVQTLLNRLTVGPSERERSRGLVTDLGPGSILILRGVSNGTATIELQAPSQDPSASKLPVAVGQVVLTATSVVGVDRVQFIRDGALIQVPGPIGGNLTSEPLIQNYYATLLAPGTPSWTRTVPAGTATTASSTTTSP